MMCLAAVMGGTYPRVERRRVMRAGAGGKEEAWREESWERVCATKGVYMWWEKGAGVNRE